MPDRLCLRDWRQWSGRRQNRHPPKPATTERRLGVRTILEIWRIASGSNPPSLAAAAASSPTAPEQIRAALRNTTPSGNDPTWLAQSLRSVLAGIGRPSSQRHLRHSTGQTFRPSVSLVDQSQAATEQLLGNQVPETVWLAREARGLGAIAASAFGAGFGGSVWALVARKTRSIRTTLAGGLPAQRTFSRTRKPVPPHTTWPSSDAALAPWNGELRTVH